MTARHPPPTRAEILEQLKLFRDWAPQLGHPPGANGLPCVALTRFGGPGLGNWHYRKSDQGTNALREELTDAFLEEVADGQLEMLHRGTGHALGFYSAFDSSTLALTEWSHVLKIESDTATVEDQLDTYREFEHCYGVKLTLVDTGNKSIHAYLALNDRIHTRLYPAVNRCFTELVSDCASKIDIGYAADASVNKITQTMRLPGAIHRKSGALAKLIQLGEPAALSAISVDLDDVKELMERDRNTRAMERHNENGAVLGYTGEAATDLLISLAAAWPVRVVGSGTYDVVKTLVMMLVDLRNPDGAAEILFRANHNDANGDHDLEGLRTWCKSFKPAGWPHEKAVQYLIDTATRRYEWKRPQIRIPNLLAKPTHMVQDKDELDNLLVDLPGDALLTAKTGVGKSEVGIPAVVDPVLMSQELHGDNSKLSAFICTPRVKLNEQIAEKYGLHNLSDPGRTSPETPKNIYVGCPMGSFGEPGKRWGDPKLFGAYKCLGDVHSSWMPDRPTGRGMVAPLTFLDELRQTLEMLLVGNLFADNPEGRLSCFRNLTTSIGNSPMLIAADAQIGEPELEFYRWLRNCEPVVIGSTLQQARGTYYVHTERKAWKARLLAEYKSKARTKPLFAIVAGRGDANEDSTAGLSAHSLKRWLAEESPDIRVVVIESFSSEGKSKSRPTPEQRRVLRGEVDGVDVVLSTPAMQSGYSFVGAFHPVIFAAGGTTLPPSIVGGQIRRERTAVEAHAYLPRSQPCMDFPFRATSAEEIEELTLADYKRRGRPTTPEVRALIRFQSLYMARQNEELALFRDYAEAYAAADGWAVELAPAAEQHEAKKTKGATKRTAPIAWDELPTLRRFLLRLLRADLTLDGFLAKEAKRSSVAVGTDLVAENGDRLAELLLESKLMELCDGRHRTSNDPGVAHCADVLGTDQAQALLSQSNLLEFREVRRAVHDDPAEQVEADRKYRTKLIGKVVRGLGGVTDSKSVKENGKPVRGFAWCLPVQEVDVVAKVTGRKLPLRLPAEPDEPVQLAIDGPEWVA